MTSQVKIPYYPKVIATCQETTFGAVEVTCPQIYETPISGMRIARVDLLECLRELFGDNCMLYRDMFYKLVSGSCATQSEHIELFASYYRRFKTVMLHINELYYYGDTDIPIIPRTLNPIRERITDYYEEVVGQFERAGGKYLLHTHDYVYYAFKGNNEIPNVKGLKVIC